MFGSTCLKVSGKVFAVAYNGRLVLKLPAERVEGRPLWSRRPVRSRPRKNLEGVGVGRARNERRMAQAQAFEALKRHVESGQRGIAGGAL